MIYVVGCVYIFCLAGFAGCVIGAGLGLVNAQIAIVAGTLQCVIGYLAAGYIDNKERAGNDRI